MAEQTWQWGVFWIGGLAEPAFPAPEPKHPAGPAPVDHGPRGKTPRRWPVLALLLGVALTVGVWNARRRQQPAVPGEAPVAAVRTAKVVAGPFQETLRISGSVAAKSFAAIVAPQQRGRDGGGSPGGGSRGGGPSGGLGSLVLIKLAAAGSPVKKGDLIAQFDSQWETDHMDEHHARLIQYRAIVDKRRAEAAIEAETEQQHLRQARADHEKAKLDRKTVEVRSAIDAEKLALMVDETAARTKQFEEQVRLKKLSHQAEIRSLEMTVEQEQFNIDRHNRNIERMTVRAPIDGLVVMQSIFRSGQFGQVQEGDQVTPGTFFMQIVDLSQMIVNANVNQVSSHSLVLGQKATIRLEAYPGLTLPGKLISLGAMAGAGSRGYRGSSRDLFVKQIPVRFAIEARDQRLIPDLSASADVVLHHEEKKLQVPREAVVEESGKPFVILTRGEQLEKRPIQLGRRNGTHYAVLAGLAEGDEVSLEP